MWNSISAIASGISRPCAPERARPTITFRVLRATRRARVTAPDLLPRITRNAGAVPGASAHRGENKGSLWPGSGFRGGDQSSCEGTRLIASTKQESGIWITVDLDRVVGLGQCSRSDFNRRRSASLAFRITRVITGAATAALEPGGPRPAPARVHAPGRLRDRRRPQRLHEARGSGGRGRRAGRSLNPRLARFRPSVGQRRHERDAMSATFLYMSISLDGFMTRTSFWWEACRAAANTVEREENTKRAPLLCCPERASRTCGSASPGWRASPTAQ